MVKTLIINILSSKEFGVKRTEFNKKWQTGSHDNTASKVVKTNLYKEDSNHWGWHNRSGEKPQSKYEA